MLTIRRSTETGLKDVERPTKGCWVDITDPSPDETRNVARDLRIPVEFVISALDLDELPRIQKTDDALLILVRIPYFQSASASIPYVTRPIGIWVKSTQSSKSWRIVCNDRFRIERCFRTT